MQNADVHKALNNYHTTIMTYSVICCILGQELKREEREKEES